MPRDSLDNGSAKTSSFRKWPEQECLWAYELTPQETRRIFSLQNGQTKREPDCPKISTQSPRIQPQKINKIIIIIKKKISARLLRLRSQELPSRNAGGRPGRWRPSLLKPRPFSQIPATADQSGGPVRRRANFPAKLQSRSSKKKKEREKKQIFRVVFGAAAPCSFAAPLHRNRGLFSCKKL